MTLEKENKNYYYRLVCSTVSGIVLAHILHNFFNSTVIIGIFPTSLILGMKKYNPKDILSKMVYMAIGGIIGLFTAEFLYSLPIVANLFSYIIFCGVLNLFAFNYKVIHIYYFLFYYLLFTIKGSYIELHYDEAFLQNMVQLGIIFILIFIIYKLFPSEGENIISKPYEKINIPKNHIYLHALIFLLFLNLSMLFEWRFAFFAYITLAGLYRDFNYNRMIIKAKKNIKIHSLACLMASIFSFILFAKVGNFILLIIFLTAFYMYLVKDAVYGDIKKRYEKVTLINATIIPLTLYLNTSGAILYKAHLRAVMISSIMIFSFIFLDIIVIIMSAKKIKVLKLSNIKELQKI